MSGPVVRQGAATGAARVRLFLTDVDGVLTDGGIIYDAAGVETKRFDVRDGNVWSAGYQPSGVGYQQGGPRGAAEPSRGGPPVDPLVASFNRAPARHRGEHTGWPSGDPMADFGPSPYPANDVLPVEDPAAAPTVLPFTSRSTRYAEEDQYGRHGAH